MPTELDDELLPEVAAITAEYGKDAVFSVPGTETYDFATSEKIQTAVVEHTVQITPPAPFRFAEWNGSSIIEGDLKTLIAGQDLPFTPEHDMKVTIDSLEWTMKHYSPIYSGELICAWTIGLRR